MRKKCDKEIRNSEKLVGVERIRTNPHLEERK